MIIRKNNLLWWVLVFGLLSIFTKCTQPQDNHAQYIPKEALAVFSIDLKQLYQKGNLKSLKNSAGFKKWKANLMEENDQMNDLILENLNDPTLSGLNLQKKVFVYTYSGGGVFSSNTGVVAAMQNARNFEKMLKLSNKDIEIKKNEKGYQYVELGKYEAVGWNDQVMMYIKSEGGFGRRKGLSARSYLYSFFNLDPENSLVTNQNFSKFLTKNNDLSVWYSLQAAKKDMTAALNMYRYSSRDQQILDEILNFQNSYIQYTLNFEKGRLLFNTQYELNKNLKKFYKETYGQNLSKELLSRIPHKQLLGFMGFSWNFKGLFNWIKRVEGVEQAFEKQAKEMGLSADDLLKTLQGEIVLAMTGFEKFEIKEKGSRYGDYLNQMLADHDVDAKKLADFRKRLSEIPRKVRTTYAPEMLGIVSFKSDLIPQKITETLQILLSANKVEGKSYYQFELAEMPFFIAAQKQQLMVSNREKLLEQMLNNEVNGKLPDDKMVKEATKYNNYMYMNLSFDKFPKSTQQNIKDQLQGKFGKLQENLSLFESFKAKGKDYKISMELNLSDKSRNSLELILRTVFNGVDMITLAE
ncbi:MAG TPA: hypothetical protein DCS93_36855 [Microscillaceae bacterium]|nr:hypothetical protein [Microscillaceae bacterium]